MAHKGRQITAGAFISGLFSPTNKQELVLPSTLHLPHLLGRHDQIRRSCNERPRGRYGWGTALPEEGRGLKALRRCHTFHVVLSLNRGEFFSQQEQCDKFPRQSTPVTSVFSSSTCQFCLTQDSRGIVHE